MYMGIYNQNHGKLLLIKTPTFDKISMFSLLVNQIYLFTSSNIINLGHMVVMKSNKHDL